MLSMRTRKDATSYSSFRRPAAAMTAGWVLLLLLSSSLLTGCNDYRVRFLYPRENRGDFFSERPEYAIYVAEPEDLRPSVERQGGRLRSSTGSRQ